MIFADALKTKAITAEKSDLLYNTVLVLSGSFLIALTAQIMIPLTPVPITGQTFGVLLTAALLGKARGTLAILTYLLEGLAGLPVFAGAASGFAVLFGPTGGYLLGFLPAAFIVGWLAELGWDKRVWSTALAMCLGYLVIFALGLVWLNGFIQPHQLYALGLFPFLPGTIIKISAAAAVLPTMRKFI